MNDFTKNVVRFIQEIPYGNVATYGQIARLAGNSKAARQVARILHMMSKTHELPWHRVVNVKGQIVIDDTSKQAELLQLEGITVDAKQCIDLTMYQWQYRDIQTDWMEG